MRVNITRRDRVLRIGIGVLALGLFGALDSPWRYLTLLGLIPLGTGLLGFCPGYAAIGWNRQQRSSRGSS